MSAITYTSFNNLLCEFVSDLSQTFDDHPELAKAHETFSGLVALDSTVSLPLDTFYDTFSAHSGGIMKKDPSVFRECDIPFTESFDLNNAYNEADEDTQDAIWNYLQQLFATATAVKCMPAEMMGNIESVANACLEKVASGEISEEQAKNPMFIFKQLQNNPELLKAMQERDE